jgi:anti-sigma regulatory factor (Ser/Thr protein kinase)
MDGGGEPEVRDLPPDPAAVPVARRFVAEAVARGGADGDAIDVSRLLVTELATNAVIHAHSPIRVAVVPSDDRIRVEVRDERSDPIDPPCRPEPSAEHGRGLWLVSSLSTAWGVSRDDDGKTIWFEVVAH